MATETVPAEAPDWSRSMSAVVRLVAKREVSAVCAKRAGNKPSIEVSSNGHWAKAVGSLEQLVDAGLCTRAHLPIGRRRVRAEWAEEGEGPISGWRVQLLAAGQAELTIWYRDFRGRVADVEAAQRALESMPTNEAAWRERVAIDLAFSRSLSAQFDVERCAHGGYQLSAADRQRVEAILQQRDTLMARVGLILQNATPVFDEKVRARIVADLQSRVQPHMSLPPLPALRACVEGQRPA